MNRAEFINAAEGITSADIAAAAREYEEREQYRLVAWTTLPPLNECYGLPEYSLLVKHALRKMPKKARKQAIKQAAIAERLNRIEQMVAIAELAESQGLPLEGFLPPAKYDDRDIGRRPKQL